MNGNQYRILSKILHIYILKYRLNGSSGDQT